MPKCKTTKFLLPEGLKVWDDPDSEFIDKEYLLKTNRETAVAYYDKI